MPRGHGGDLSWPLRRARRLFGFLGANSLAHVECLLAVPAFGRVLTDLNFRLSEPELRFMIGSALG